MKNRFIVASLFVGVLLTLGAVPAQATKIVRDDNFVRWGDQEVVVNDIQNGDVIVVAKSLSINGTVSGDVLAVARQITINGAVQGNVRVVAQTLIITGTVQGNVQAWAESVQFSSTSKIGRSVLARASAITADGAIGWQADVRGKSIKLNGTVGRDMLIDVPRAENFVLASTAKIAGKTHITTAASVKDKPAFADTALKIFLSYAALVLLAVVLYHVWPRFIGLVGLVAVEMKPRVFAWGLLGLVLPPLLAGVLAITIIGFPVAVTLAVLWVFLVYTAPAVFGFGLAHALGKDRVHPLVAMLVGTAAIMLIGYLPVIGGAFHLLVIIVVLGSWFFMIKETFRV